MHPEERRARILRTAWARGIVRVSDLVAELGASAATVRRDLAVLVHRGALERIHGGGVLPDASIHRPRLVPSRPSEPPRSAESARSAQSSTSPGQAVSPVGARLDSESRTGVGIVVPSGHYYFPAIVAGARRVLGRRSMRPAAVCSGYRPEQDRQIVRQLIRAGSSGLLIAPNIPLDESDPAQVRWLFELPIPAVLVERTVHVPEYGGSLCSVRTDHEGGSALAVRHLARLGHRGVALVTQGYSQTKSRVVDGWRRAIERLGLDRETSPLVVTAPAANRNVGPDNPAISSVLDRVRLTGVTAILVHSDQTAVSLVRHAREHGWSIPDDLSIVAYDDEIADLADPPLTAVSPPKQWLGRAAAEMCLRLSIERKAGPVRHLVAEPTLVVRASTAPPRTNDPFVQ